MFFDKLYFIINLSVCFKFSLLLSLPIFINLSLGYFFITLLNAFSKFHKFFLGCSDQTYNI